MANTPKTENGAEPITSAPEVPAQSRNVWLIGRIESCDTIERKLVLLTEYIALEVAKATKHLTPPTEVPAQQEEAIDSHYQTEGASMIIYFMAAGFGVFAATVIAGIVKSLKERAGEK